MTKEEEFYYRIYKRPDLFFSLLGKPAHTAARYDFLTVQLKTTGKSAGTGFVFSPKNNYKGEPMILEPDIFRLGCVLVPKHRKDPLYFVEASLERDDRFYVRFLAQVFTYLWKFESKNDWRGVVFFPNRETEITDPYTGDFFIKSGTIKRFYVDELTKGSKHETFKLLN
jgi:hypothetical protein